ncbi:hypothetical protein GCM10020295_59240 [Streptomyces cinereospinus]
MSDDRAATSDDSTTDGGTSDDSTTGAGTSATAEPRLTIRRTTHRGVPRLVVVALPLALAGLLSLMISGNALRPFERITVIESRMASKSDYFRDPEVARLLLRHGIRVDIRRLGSRGIATRSLEGLDVVFPSGQPAAKLVLDRPDDTGQTVRPFVSPWPSAASATTPRPWCGPGWPPGSGPRAGSRPSTTTSTWRSS